MKLRVFKEEFSVESLGSLRAHFPKRFQGSFGCFWLDHDNGTSMAMLVRDDKAHLTFFSGPSRLVFEPKRSSIESDELIIFRVDNHEEAEIGADSVLPEPVARAAFEEYFATGAIPKSIEWVES
jgi:hypothetical protein